MSEKVMFLVSSLNPGYIIPCSSFSFKLTNGKTVTWTYKNYFSCDSKDVIYILICKTCDNFYLRQTQDFNQRTTKHQSDVKNPHNYIYIYILISKLSLYEETTVIESRSKDSTLV